MSKINKDRGGKRPSAVNKLDLSVANGEPVNIVGTEQAERPHMGLFSRIARYRYALGAIAIGLLIGLGVMASNGWLPRTDPLSGKKTGWFNSTLPKSASSSWNPFAPPLPSPTPQLSKEYIYAGSRLVAVEDKGADAAPTADLALWRPTDGVWYVLTSAEGLKQTQITFPWGSGDDVPVVGDYDGDGKTDFSIYRHSDGIWYIVHSSNGSYHYPQFGATCTAGSGACDVPAPADYDGDGLTDLAVWRPSTGIWYIKKSSTGATITESFGQTGDKPVSSDFDGDGRSDIAVWRDSNHTFYSLNTATTGSQAVSVGATGDRPACGDFDGDGKSDFAVFKDSNATWSVKQTTNGETVPTQFGGAGDHLVQSDYDGDGKVDLAVWRSSNAHWYIKKSSTGSVRSDQWGLLGDIPVPAYYKR